MKQLFVIDLKDYSDNMPVYEKHCVRAIIIRNGKYVMQRSSKGEYKLPGGGIEKGETHMDALEREVMEETGFKIKRDTAVPHRRDNGSKKGQTFGQYEIRVPFILLRL